MAPGRASSAYRAARQSAAPPPASQASSRAGLDGLDHLETFKAGVPQIERFVVARIAMGLTEGIGTGPVFEVLARAPNGMRRIERVVVGRSEEHTSELQSLMRISYAVFCLKKKKKTDNKQKQHATHILTTNK